MLQDDIDLLRGARAIAQAEFKAELGSVWCTSTSWRRDQFPHSTGSSLPDGHARACCRSLDRRPLGPLDHHQADIVPRVAEAPHIRRYRLEDLPRAAVLDLP